MVMLRIITISMITISITFIIAIILTIDIIRDNNLYTTTNKCLQCLIILMYTVF